VEERDYATFEISHSRHFQVEEFGRHPEHIQNRFVLLCEWLIVIAYITSQAYYFYNFYNTIFE